MYYLPSLAKILKRHRQWWRPYSIRVMSHAPWHLKSPATEMFVLQSIEADIKGNIKILYCWPFVRGILYDCWFEVQCGASWTQGVTRLFCAPGSVIFMGNPLLCSVKIFGLWNRLGCNTGQTPTRIDRSVWSTTPPTSKLLHTPKYFVCRTVIGWGKKYSLQLTVVTVCVYG